MRDGGRWLEIQVDPSGYAAQVRRDHGLHRPGARRRPRRRGAHRARHRGGDRGQPHPAPARRPHAGPAGCPVRRSRGGRVRAVQRRAPRGHLGVRGRVRDRRAGRTRCSLLTAASCWAPTAFARASTCCTPTGSVTACAPPRTPSLLDRIVRGRGRARGLPGLQRGPRRLHRPDLGAAADPARGRRHRRARRRRPAAVRLPAGRAVRHHARRPRAHRRSSSPSWPGCRCGPPGRPTTRRRSIAADIDVWLAAGPGSIAP